MIADCQTVFSSTYAFHVSKFCFTTLLRLNLMGKQAQAEFPLTRGGITILCVLIIQNNSRFSVLEPNRFYLGRKMLIETIKVVKKVVESALLGWKKQLKSLEKKIDTLRLVVE